MKYIFGLGLPRTCTNSLVKALNALGINGECKCILTNYENKHNQHNNQNKYIMHNDSYRHLNTILSSDNIHENLYILTIRDEDDWKKSLLKHDNNLVTEELIDLGMNNYKHKVIDFFKNGNCLHNLLILNIFEEEDSVLWDKLSHFLGIECDCTQPFPNVKLG